MGEEAEQYSRRVDDLIAIVQKTIDDVDDFVKGRVKVEPYEYQKVKRDLMARQSAALDAMHKAIAGQQAVLRDMDKTGEPLPQRRASDRPMSNEDREILEIQARAGIIKEGAFDDMSDEEFLRMQGDTESDYMRDIQMMMWKSAKQRKGIQWNEIARMAQSVADGGMKDVDAIQAIKKMLG